MDKTLENYKLAIIASDVTQAALDAFRDAFPALEIIHRKVLWWSPEETADILSDEEWKDVHFLVTGVWCIPAVEKVPKLEYIQLPMAGVEMTAKHSMWTKKDITICSANGVHGPQIPEWIIAQYLSAQHHRQATATWDRPMEWRDTKEAYKQRVGIFGYGAIGRQLARICKALGMDIYAFTSRPRDTAESKKDRSYSSPGLGDPEGVFPDKWFSGTSRSDLHDFLAGLDLLVLTTPLTEATKHLISKPEFEVMSQKKTFVVNVSRGGIINTDDLVEALNSDKIRGAALDVTEPEPLPDGHPLWKAKNVVITPHISAATDKLTERVLDLVLQNLKRRVEGKEMMNVVELDRGY